MFQLREKTGSNRGLTGKKTSEAPYSLRLDMFGKSQHSYNSFNMILKNSKVDNSIKCSNLEWCTHTKSRLKTTQLLRCLWTWTLTVVIFLSHHYLYLTPRNTNEQLLLLSLRVQKMVYFKTAFKGVIFCDLLQDFCRRTVRMCTSGYACRKVQFQSALTKKAK